MKLAFLAAAAFLGLAPVAPQQEKSTFVAQYVGLQFQYPSDWKITKKLKDQTVFSIPVENSSEPAELFLSTTDFRAEKDLFQTVQVRINEQLGRQVVRQWEQEILGVPMLFTRINYVRDGVSRTTLSGLYYTRTPLKMVVRLDAREADYDSVAYFFHQAMESLRTVDGSTPLPDDPKVKLEPVAKNPVAANTVTTLGGDKKPTVVRPAQSVDLTVSQRSVRLLYPEGWVLEKTDAGAVLRHPEVAQPLVLTVYSTLDSDPPLRALFKASSKSLQLYQKVDAREDRGFEPNRAGARLATTWRTGQAEKGPVATFEAVAQQGEFYVLITYRLDSMANFKSERRVVDTLVNHLTLESGA